MFKKATIGIALLALGAALMPDAFAQTVVTGDVAGTVTDQTGGVIASGTVTIKNLANGYTKTATTGKSGDFRFPLLVPGPYSVSATAKGFSTTEKQVQVDLGQVQNVKLSLGVAGTAQVVEVSESVEMLQGENANLATTYDQSQVANLPSPGGDLTNYAMFAPGVTLSTGSAYGNFSAVGLPGTSNLFTMNGLDVNDPFLNIANSGSSNMLLGTNEVAEVAVVINGYTGQYGRQAGAQVNYATKTGTNQFHGNLSWLWNGRDMNANDWFNNATGTSRQFAIANQWADSFGGPIIKNKLFVFFSNEGVRYVLPSAGPVFIPTTAFATAVLNNLKATNAAAVPLYTQAFNVWANSPAASHATPVTAALDPQLGCGNLTGNAGQFGITQPCAEQFQNTANSLNKEWLAAWRLDYNINSSNKIFARFWMDRGVQATSTDAINSAFSVISKQPQANGQVGWTASIGPRMVNQLIASASYYTAIFGPTNLPAALAVFPTSFAFTDGLFSTLGGGTCGGCPLSGTTDYSYPSGRNVRTRHLVDDFAVSTGTHTVKFGVNVREIGWTDFSAQSGGSGLYSFADMNDFYNGSLQNGSTYAQSFINQGASGLHAYSLGFYGQDEWKVNSKLNVTIAFRFDRNSNIGCDKNCFNELANDFGSVIHNAAIPYNQVIQTNVKNVFPAIDAIVPEPRVGFAYSLDDKTVIRGGIGIFSDLYQPLIATRYETNFPGNPNFSTSSGLVAPGNGKGASTALQNSYNALLSGFGSGATLASLSAVPGFAPFNYNTISPNINNPTYYEWNFEIQRALSRAVTLSVNYVGNHGSNEFLENVLGNGYAANGFGGLPTTVPDPRFGEIRDFYNNAFSDYDGLITSVRWHVGSQFQGAFNFTWSHSLDICSNNCLEPYNALAAPSLRYQVAPSLALNYSNSDYDVRHSLNANYVYSPKVRLNNWLAKGVLNGWTVAGTALYHSGYPFTVQDSGVRSAQGVKNLNGIATDTFIADWVGGGNGYPSCTTPNTSCYSSSLWSKAANQHDFGNIPRNSFRGPGYFDTDMNVHKTFSIHERFNFLVGIYAFNLFNHPNFDLPFNNTATGTFGSILETVGPPNSPYGNFEGSAVSGRVIQTQVKFSF